MRLRYYLLTLPLVLAAGVCAVLLLLPAPQSQIDVVQVNDVVATLSNEFGQLESEGYHLPTSDYDYAVVDKEGDLLAATREGISGNLNEAIQQGDLIIDVNLDGEVVGKAIFYIDSASHWQTYQNTLQITAIIVLLCMAAACAVFFFVLDRRVLAPFRKMSGFAERVAAGELDAPLEMDKNNAFGAFTESFDLMRDELRTARENEHAAKQSKRELVASLSHDIQTPVASIKAVAELMEVTADEEQRQKLQTIQQKTGQIHTLVADLFHATLEELDSLTVAVMSLPSDQIIEIIKRADYVGKAQIGEIPGCLLKADPVRLAQVVDNIIANSYKYADTALDVSAEFLDEGLMVTFRDYGPGVETEELALLSSKYFRGKSAEGKAGYGLGLFISCFLVERMGGHLDYANAQPGFVVYLWLRLDS